MLCQAVRVAYVATFTFLDAYVSAYRHVPPGTFTLLFSVLLLVSESLVKRFKCTAIATATATATATAATATATANAAAAAAAAATAAALPRPILYKYDVTPTRACIPASFPLQRPPPLANG